MANNDLGVRAARDADAGRIAELCEQLGYPEPAAAVAARLARLARDPEGAVFVAEDGAGRVVGWVHVYASLLLQADRHAELGGLVVDAAARGTGAGRRLVEAAEDWARAHGCAYLSLRSNVVRGGAHEFYRRLGYEVVKTQLKFRKDL